MIYDFILFENFHSAFHHKYDVLLIARLLKSKGLKIAVLNIYGEDNPKDFPGIDFIELPFKDCPPNDKAWLEYKGSVFFRLFYVIRFLFQQRRYMRKVRSFVSDKANSFYLGSYHLLMPTTFMNLKKNCYYWGLRSYRMTGFFTLFLKNPFLAFRMIYLKNSFLKNDSQSLFVSNEIIKNEFLQIGIPENRLIIREERCIENIKLFNPNSKDSYFSLLVIGGLRRQKHIEKTIAAFKRANLQNSVLRLVGENNDTIYENIILKEIERCNNIERINKHLQYDVFNRYIENSHFTLFADEKAASTVTNGTMMESIINYTPIIAPDYDPYSYYVKKYGIGLTYQPDNIENYAFTIKKAQELGYNSFIDNITKFQKSIEFGNVASQLYDSLMQLRK